MAANDEPGMENLLSNMNEMRTEEYELKSKNHELRH
jgi:hypothetical protein